MQVCTNFLLNFVRIWTTQKFAYMTTSQNDFSNSEFFCLYGVLYFSPSAFFISFFSIVQRGFRLAKYCFALRYVEIQKDGLRKYTWVNFGVVRSVRFRATCWMCCWFLVQRRNFPHVFLKLFTLNHLKQTYFWSLIVLITVW